MQAIAFDPSAPAGAALVRLPDPGAPGPGEVRVRMRLAPINPADRLVLAGRYAPLGGLPEIVGAEGMGVVDAVGTDVEGVAVGSRVILLSRGNWAEWRRVPAADVLVVPSDLPDEQAAILRINPATASRLLDRLALAPGQSLIQNAARSSVAGWVRRLAVRRGIRVLDVARHASGDDMLPDDETLPDRVRLMSDAGVAGALDAVAGEATGRLAACLAPEGRLQVYGHLSGRPCEIASTLLTTRSLSVQGFTLRAAEACESRAHRAGLYADLARIGSREPEPIAATFPLGDIAAALALVADRPRGRVLLSA